MERTKTNLAKETVRLLANATNVCGSSHDGHYIAHSIICPLTHAIYLLLLELLRLEAMPPPPYLEKSRTSYCCHRKEIWVFQAKNTSKLNIIEVYLSPLCKSAASHTGPLPGTWSRACVESCRPTRWAQISRLMPGNICTLNNSFMQENHVALGKTLSATWFIILPIPFLS